MRITCIILSVMFLADFSAYAQDADRVTVKGTVTDSSGEPLAGTMVIVKGATNGSMADADGKYSIEVNSSDVLIYSMMGFVDHEVTVGKNTEIDVILKTDAVALEEAMVVEIGYGGQARKDLTGTVSIVKMDDVIKAPVMNFDQALQGRMAGVSVSSADGQPGSDMEIVIRGANSLTQSNAPLYVVDGFPMEDFSSAPINSNDIESLTVLKDASATAIYGARGANGVIIIETKKGFEGRPVITYNGTFGFQMATKKMEMMDAYEFVEYQIERKPSNIDTYLTNPGLTLEDYKKFGKGTDWQDEMFRVAPIHMHNLSMTGGTKATKYSVSLSAADQQGVLLNSGYQKYQGRISLTQQLNKKAKVTVNASFTQDKTYGQTSASALTSNNAYASYLMYRIWGYRPVTPEGMIEDDELFDEEDGGSGTSAMNPLLSTQNEDKVQRRVTFITNAKLQWDIIKGLRLSVSGGYSRFLNLNTEFNNSMTYKGYPHSNNALGVNGLNTNWHRSSWVNENTLTWDKGWNKDKHKLSTVIGFTLEGFRSEKYGYTSKFIPIESLGVSGMDNGLSDKLVAELSRNTLMSGLARINYNYRSRYLVTASFRADGSSKFAPGKRWGFFPSGAFAWRISKEDFMKRVRFVNDLKLRATWGLTGNNRVGDFSRWPSMDMTDYYAFDTGSPGEAMTPVGMGNRQLTWETTEQIDLGLDLRVLKNRVSLTVDWYQKVTRDLLLNANIPTSTGFASVYKNIGKVRNRGLEVSLSTINIRTRDFEWTSDFNISFNRSKVLELAEGEMNYLSKVNFTGDFKNTYLYIARVGEPMAQFYGMQWDGVYGYDDFNLDNSGKYVLKSNVPTNGNSRENIQPGDIKYVDQNGDGVVNDQDMVVIGRCEPLHVGGFNNNFSYKGFSLSVFLQWRYGSDIMNANRIMFEGNYSNKSINQFKSYVDRWSPTNTDSRNFRVGGRGPNGVYSSMTIEDGSFLRLKTVQLSYTFPEKWMKKIHLETLQLFISGENLCTWTAYSGLDPEVSTHNSALTPGFDYSAYARNRIFTGGVKIVF